MTNENDQSRVGPSVPCVDELDLPQSGNEAQSPLKKEDPYFVQVDTNGCNQCGYDRTWTVVGPDGACIGQSFQDEERADDLADYMNQAFWVGRTDPQRKPADEVFCDCCGKAVAEIRCQACQPSGDRRTDAQRQADGGW